MSAVQLIIPAAGLGSRFKDSGFNVPKPFIQVGTIPMIYWVVSNFALNRDDRVVIILNSQMSIQEIEIENLKAFNKNIEIVFLSQLSEGPADTVNKVKRAIISDLPIIIANSDQYISSGLDSYVTNVRSRAFDGNVVTMQATGNKWSYVGRDVQGNPMIFKEKKEISNEATAGIYSWNQPERFFEYFNLAYEKKDKVNNEYYVAPLYNYALSDGLNISLSNIGEVEKSMHGLGTPEDLALFLNSDIFRQLDDKFSRNMNNE